MPSKISKTLGVFLFCLLTLGAALAQTPQFVPFASAQPVLSAMRDALPPELKTSGPVTADAWNKWVRDRDKEIRARIEGGEAETLTNLLRLGVTYTKEPRISFVDLQNYGKNRTVDSLAEKRADAKACWKCASSSKRRASVRRPPTGERRSRPTCWPIWRTSATT